MLKPTGNTGPDLKVAVEGVEVFVEVTRFREDEDLRNRMEESNEMVQMPERSQKILAKVSNKSKQLPEGTPGVILMHSNDVGSSELQFQQAVAWNKTPLSKCSGVLFMDTWGRLDDNMYPVCWGFINGSARTPIKPDAMGKLGRCLDSNFKVLSDGEPD